MQRKHKINQYRTDLEKLNTLLLFIREHKIRISYELENITNKFSESLITTTEHNNMVNSVLQGKTKEEVFDYYDTLALRYLGEIAKTEEMINQERSLLENPPKPNSHILFFIGTLIVLGGIFSSLVDLQTNSAVSYAIYDVMQNKSSPTNYSVAEESSKAQLKQETPVENPSKNVQLMEEILFLAKDSDLSNKKEELLSVIEKIDITLG